MINESWLKNNQDPARENLNQKIILDLLELAICHEHWEENSGAKRRKTCSDPVLRFFLEAKVRCSCAGAVCAFL
jgi:hypothetical protein